MNRDEHTVSIAVTEFDEVGDFGFQVEFYDTFGSLGHTNIYHYSVYDNDKIENPIIDTYSAQVDISG